MLGSVYDFWTLGIPQHFGIVLSERGISQHSMDHLVILHGAPLDWLPAIMRTGNWPHKISVTDMCNEVLFFLDFSQGKHCC